MYVKTLVRTVVAIIVMMAGGGCALLFPGNYLSAEGEYEYTGEKSAEVTFESNAENWVVKPSISLSDVACKDFKSAGYLFNDAQSRSKGFLGAIQRKNPLKPDEQLVLVRKVPAPGTVQVAVSARQDVAGVSRTCSNLLVKFETEENAKYRAFLDVEKCTLQISNESKNGQRVFLLPLVCS